MDFALLGTLRALWLFSARLPVTGSKDSPRLANIGCEQLLSSLNPRCVMLFGNLHALMPEQH